jgi:hypothetical protein
MMINVKRIIKRNREIRNRYTFIILIVIKVIVNNNYSNVFLHRYIYGNVIRLKTQLKRVVVHIPVKIKYVYKNTFE